MGGVTDPGGMPGKIPLQGGAGTSGLGGPDAGPPVVPLTGRNPSLARSNPSLINNGPFGMPMKKGGKVKHSDEAEDKKLIRKMMKQEEKIEGKKRGGSVKKYQDGGGPTAQDVADDEAEDLKGTIGDILSGTKKVSEASKPTPKVGDSGEARAQGAAASAANVGAGAAKMSAGLSAAGGSRSGYKPAPPPGGSQGFQIAKDGGFIAKNADSKDRALASYKYRNQGTGYARGGGVKGVKKAGGLSGLGRLEKIPAARGVPAKTEI